MTYYNNSQYLERWYMEFKDIRGGMWHISIQDPTWRSEDKTQLTPSENPFDWQGTGDEDQTKCILGSTGTMRIMVTNEADIAGLRPTAMNNRRIVAERNGSIVWQGFIGVEEYTQDWIGAPYELELPIRSALDLANDMPLPELNSTEYLLGANIQSTADVFRFAMRLLSVNQDAYLVTNNPIYFDYNGNARKKRDGREIAGSGDSKMHWTQAYASPATFYDVDGLCVTPKTIGEMLETILYPYGRLTEIGTNWFARLTRRIYFDDDKSLYYLSMDSLGIGDTFTKSNYLFRHISDKNIDGEDITLLTIAGDDNKVSRIAAPSSVSFTANAETSDTIIDFDKDMIDSGVDTSRQLSIYSSEDYKEWTYGLALSSSEIKDDNNLITYHRDVASDEVGVNPYRILYRDGDSKELTESANLAFRIKGGFDGFKNIPIYSRVFIRIPHRVRTIKYYNMLRLTLEIFDANGIKYKDTPDERLLYRIKCGDKYLNANSNEDSDYDSSGIRIDHWDTDEDFHTVAGIYTGISDGKYTIEFNEPRDSNDMKMKELEIDFEVYGAFPNRVITYIIKPKLEYIEFNELTDEKIRLKMFDNFAYNKTRIATGGSGESIDISMKTCVADKFSLGGKTSNAPWAGFCDEKMNIYTGKGYIDRYDRTKLEIPEAKTDSPTVLVTSPFFYTHGDEEAQYFPASIGMNARNCTYNLTLVSTNI